MKWCDGPSKQSLIIQFNNENIQAKYVALIKQIYL